MRLRGRRRRIHGSVETSPSEFLVASAAFNTKGGKRSFAAPRPTSVDRRTPVVRCDAARSVAEPACVEVHGALRILRRRIELGRPARPDPGLPRVGHDVIIAGIDGMRPKPRPKGRSRHLIIRHRIGPAGQCAMALGTLPLAWFCAATGVRPSAWTRQAAFCDRSGAFLFSN